MFNVFGVNDERARDIFDDIIALDPVMARHVLQFQLSLPHSRRTSLPVGEWWAPFRSYMGQMFDITCNLMNNSRWDNPCAFRDQYDHANWQTTSSGKVKCTCERFSWYGSNNPRAQIELPSYRQYMPSDLLAVGPLNWDEEINEDNEEENRADPGVRSS